MATAMPTLNSRSPNSRSGTSGEPSRRVLTCSHQTNRANTGTEAAIDTNVQPGQPSSRPSTRGYSRSSSAALTRATPSGSSRGGRGERDSRTSTADAITARIPTGTLIRKMGRQLRPNRSC